MRNALILLAVVAVIILAFGAVNNGTTFEIDYVAGTVNAVSLFWVSAVIAGLVFVTGLAATWFALAGAAGGRRKLEAELQKTYTRLREAEALVASRAPAPAPEPTVVAAPAEPATVVDVEDATAVASEDATVAAEDETAAADAPAEAGEQTAVTMAAEGGASEEGASDEALDDDAAVESDEPGEAEAGEPATPDS